MYNRAAPRCTVVAATLAAVLPGLYVWSKHQTGERWRIVVLIPVAVSNRQAGFILRFTPGPCSAYVCQDAPPTAPIIGFSLTNSILMLIPERLVMRILLRAILGL